MKQPLRILIAGLTAEKGGMEAYVMNLYRFMDRDRIQFDFVNHLKGEPIAYQEEIEALGGKIYNIPMLRNGIREHFAKLKKLFQENSYAAVYYQANRRMKSTDLFRYAKKYQVPLRILHSHNTKTAENESGLNRLRAQLIRNQLDRYLTDRFACSKEAGEWMFGEDANFRVINNGVDCAKFDFNASARQDVRQSMKAEDRRVYGTVGRLSDQKNPFFLADIFAEIHRLQPESVFWHIGGGEYEQEMKEYIKEKGIADSYLLLGRRDDVAELLSGMDVYLMPSKYEGFPISLVEAQCNGLTCVVSDVITKDVDLSGNVQFVSLNKSAAEWAESAVNLSGNPRKSEREKIREKGYDIHQIVKELSEYIEKKAGGEGR